MEAKVLTTGSPAQTHTLERRASTRLPMMRPTQYSVDNRLLIGELLDIGQDGVRLRATQPLATGTLVRIHLSLPGSAQFRAKTLVLSARVVWQRNHIVGLTFDELSLEARANIHLVLDRELAARAT